MKIFFAGRWSFHPFFVASLPSWFRYFCRTALRLWIIDFFLIQVKQKQRHEQPFLPLFRDFPPQHQDLFASHSPALPRESRVLVIGNSSEGGKQASVHICVYIHRMLFLRYILLLLLLLYVRTLFVWIYEENPNGVLCMFGFSSPRTGEKFLNLLFFFSRLLDPLRTYPKTGPQFKFSKILAVSLWSIFGKVVFLLVLHEALEQPSSSSV